MYRKRVFKQRGEDTLKKDSLSLIASILGLSSLFMTFFIHSRLCVRPPPTPLNLPIVYGAISFYSYKNNFFVFFFSLLADGYGFLKRACHGGSTEHQHHGAGH